MIKLLDGPAAGKELALRRAPVYLRVVIDDITGRVDALDQLDDVPTSTEAVHVYRGERGTLSALRDDIIVCVRGPGGLQQVASAAGKYRYLPEADGEQLRETDAWREWVQAQPPLEVAT